MKDREARVMGAIAALREGAEREAAALAARAAASRLEAERALGLLPGVLAYAPEIAQSAARRASKLMDQAAQLEGKLESEKKRALKLAHAHGLFHERRARRLAREAESALAEMSADRAARQAMKQPAARKLS